MGEQLALDGVRSAGVLDAPLVFVDIETNGLSHIKGRVIEVAAIRVENGRITREFNQLIDPGTPLPEYITTLTGIRTEDLRGATKFRQIAGELYDVMDGAIFVAHNVRFDYSFLKAEFKRAGQDFLPKQLCTVKLSKALYPGERRHSLETLIQRHSFTYAQRHRAYDDAHVLWQFVQHVLSNFPYETVENAVKRQFRQPAMPKGLVPDLVKGLPDTPGVYIFEDDQGRPLYVGKSINIRKRVLQHFGHDHDIAKEFKISQTVKHISTHITAGELEALLLESRLVKEMMPLYNQKLRRTNKLLIVREAADERGYATISLEEANGLEPGNLGGILAVYDRRSRAKSALTGMVKQSELCPKLLGLEKSRGACFLSQLRKCRGACAGKESAEDYNRRLHLAFERQRIREWPYDGPVLVQERFNLDSPLSGRTDGISSGIIVDKWCVLAEIEQQPHCDPSVTRHSRTFDLDTYKILQQFLGAKVHKLVIQPLSAGQLTQFGLA
jgi:DNA polymerase-3 subunit epsilon